MSYYLRFDKAIKNGYIKEVRVTTISNVVSPPNNKAWLILAGTVSHYIDYPTYVAFLANKYDANSHIMNIYISAAAATGVYNIFNASPQAGFISMPAWQPVVLTDAGGILMQATYLDTEIRLLVLEWDTS